MKAKISLGSGRIKGLIVGHVEKAVVALAVLFFFLLVWKSSKLGNDFDLKPDQLKTTSVDADKAIRAPKKGPDPNVPPWEDIADKIRTPVPSWPYGIGKTWMHRLFPGAILRGQPEAFPVEELRGSTGFGGIALKPTVGADGTSDAGAASAAMTTMGESGSGSGGMGGGKVEGRRWVVVTGLLPYKKQWIEYGDAFRNAEIKDPRRDVPAYNDYDVQRAEVVPGVEPDEDDWQSLNVAKEFFTRTASWAGSRPEIVYGKFIHRSNGVFPMAYPLPPLVSKNFGAEIAHEPEIPLFYQVERKVEEEEPDWETLAKDPEALAKAKAKLRSRGMGGPMGSMGSGDMMGSGSSDMMGSGSSDMMGSGAEYMQDYGSGFGMGSVGAEMGSGMGMDMSMMGSGGYGMTGPRRDIPEYQLFRFFDFSVQPGRYYQYRVRLRLANPNRGLPIQHLEDEKLAEPMFIETPWSVETKIVSVPFDSRVLVGPVSVPANVNAEPGADLGTVFFNAEDGEEVAEKFAPIRRGMLMNFFDRDVKKEKPQASPFGMGSSELAASVDPYSMYGPVGSGSMDPRAKKPEKEEPPKKVSYVTEMLVLDFDGGDPLPGTDRNLKAPGRILLMDPAGNLVLDDELTDQEEWVKFFPPEVKKKEVEMPMGSEGSSEMMMEQMMPY